VLKWGLFGTLLLILGGGGAAFLSFFYPKRTSPFGGKITVPGAVADYPVGSVTRIREGKFYLSHVPAGLLALYWKCAHLGCTVPWKPDEEFQGQVGVFHCPCHGSIYLPTGQNVAGPAPHPLDIMDITVVGGKIVVDTGKRTTRVSTSRLRRRKYRWVLGAGGLACDPQHPTCVDVGFSHDLEESCAIK